MTAYRPIRLLLQCPPLLLALLIGKLWFSGTLEYYVNTRTVWIVLLGGILFALVGCVSLVGAWRDKDAAPPMPWRTLVFVVPIVVGLLIPARPLSAATGQSSSLGSLQLASHVSGGGSGDSFPHWVSALAAHPDPDWWSGQRVTMVGFVARQNGLPLHSVIVGRYLVTCCVVDAALLGFPVQLSSGPIPGEGAWVQVNGVFGRRYWTDPSGARYPLIERAKLTSVTVPSSPYLSP